MSVTSKRPAERGYRLMIYTALVLFGLMTLYPFYYFIILSLNDGLDAARGGIYLWPRKFTLANYIRAFQNPNIANAFSISLFRTAVGTVVSLVLNSLLAYGLTKKDLPFRKQIIFYFFFTTIFSGGTIPFYILLSQMGLTKSVWIYVVPYLFVFLYMVIIRTSFESIPAELSEAALIDGCGELQILFKIFIPLSLPVMATMALFFGVYHWNDWFTGAFYVSNKSMVPAATLLQQLMTEASFEASGGLNREMPGRVSMQTTPEALRMAFLVITTAPILCVYPFIQKYFTKGIMVGSLKG